jgi:hypothetical protein
MAFDQGSATIGPDKVAVMIRSEEPFRPVNPVHLLACGIWHMGKEASRGISCTS